MYKKIAFFVSITILLIFVGLRTATAFAETVTVTPSITATSTATPTITQAVQNKVDVTKPDTSLDQQIITTLFIKRPATK
ncbi:MAG TPA: hypothetical protein VLF93_08095, partial [Candidatus Saccharimonadales bacterium]|nr:hypothetical protein [Candidatus Saccharimonadales bacterium]